MQANTVECVTCGQRNRVPASAAGRPRCARCQRWMPWIVVACDDDFMEVADNCTLPVLVDFWATRSGPCQIVSPTLVQLAYERAGQLKLVKVDIDANPGLTQRFSVQSAPTLLVLDRGRQLARQSGAPPLATLRHWVDRALSGTTPKVATS